jgi:hypothetical protein
MFDREQLREAERTCGFHYPASFLAIADDFAAIAASASFAEAFPDSCLVSTAGQIQAAWKAGLPDTLIPFFEEKQPHHTDFFCFYRAESSPGPPVVVFAVHTIVHDWNDFIAFLNWLRQCCSTAAAARQTRAS